MNAQRIVSLLVLLSIVRVSAITFTGSYSQNFDTLASTGTPNPTSPVPWANDTTIAGWYLFQQGSPNIPVTSYSTSSGTASAGGFYSFGNSSERALGGIGSGNFQGWIAAAFANSSGGLFDSFTVQWNGEQWRNSGAVGQSMVFEYGFGTTFDTVATWLPPGGTFNWTSPVTGGSASAVDGNTAGRVNSVGGTISGVSWANNQMLWLRWAERDDTGTDHSLAIDDFIIRAQVVQTVPETLPIGIEIGVLLGLVAFARRFAARTV